MRSWSASGLWGPKPRSRDMRSSAKTDRKTLGEYGAVGEMLCNVYDDQGRARRSSPQPVRHVGPARGRARRPGPRVGGRRSPQTCGDPRSALKLLKPTTLVTDSVTARKLTGAPT